MGHCLLMRRDVVRFSWNSSNSSSIMILLCNYRQVTLIRGLKASRMIMMMLIYTLNNAKPQKDKTYNANRLIIRANIKDNKSSYRWIKKSYNLGRYNSKRRDKGSNEGKKKLLSSGSNLLSSMKDKRV